MNYKNLEQFLYYLQDKIQTCYKYETSQAIQEYLKEMKGSGNYEK